jgi:hypothetical protein
MKLARWIVPLAVFVLVVGLVVGRQQREVAPPPLLACADLAQACSTRLDGVEVTVGVVGELKPLQPFTVWVRRPGATAVQASFSMEGMDMGFNRYTLKPDADGVFRGRVTLPVCVSGRRDWLMTLTMDGQALAVPFTTDL